MQPEFSTIEYARVARNYGTGSAFRADTGRSSADIRVEGPSQSRADSDPVESTVCRFSYNPATMLDSILACPRCDGALTPQPDALACPGCRVTLPVFDGLPFIFAEPTATLGEWKARWHMETQRLDTDAQRYARALEAAEPDGPTHRRLALLARASTDHADRLRALLAPLELDALQAGHESYLALRTRLPTHQGLNTYYHNVHRDWCWGDEENSASTDIVAEALDTVTGRMLVLGSGGSRLAYDLHRRFRPEATVALDFNPMLLLLARRLARGETVELWEFPPAPKSIDDCAVLRTLAAPEPADENLHFIVADALRAPFRPGSFDTIVTPWISDILPEDFGVFGARINRLLGPGGRWLNFGSLAFDRPDPAQNYSLEEAMGLIERQGFAAPTVREDTIPYMCSPASRHGRRETVVTFVAAKHDDAPSVPRHMALPDWVVKGTEPVPLLPSFQMQAMTTRIHAFVMAMIDGKRSIADMARLMEEQRLMTAEEATPVIRSFLIRMLE